MSTKSFQFSTASAEFWDQNLNRQIQQIASRDYLKNYFQKMEDFMAPIFFTKKRYSLPLRPPILTQESVDTIHYITWQTVEIFESLVLRGGGPLFNERHPFNIFQKDAELFLSRRLSPYIFSRKFGRPDYVVSKGRPYLLELNLHSCIDPAPELEHLARWYLNSPAGIVTNENFSLRAYSCLERLAQAFKNVTLGSTLGVAVLDCDKNRGFFPAMLSLHGLPSSYVHVSEMQEKNGKLHANGLTFDLYLKDFTTNYLHEDIDDSGRREIDNVTRQGKTVGYSDDSVMTVSDKRLFAMAYEKQHELANHEAEFIRNYLPASFLVEPGKTIQFENEKLSLETLLEARHRHKFVLKPGVGQQGTDVICGEETSAADWEKIVRKCLFDYPEQYILQEYKPSDIFELPFFNEESQNIDYLKFKYVLSQYLIDQGPSLGFFRYVPLEKDSIINYARGAMRSVVLTENV